MTTGAWGLPKATPPAASRIAMRGFCSPEAPLIVARIVLEITKKKPPARWPGGFDDESRPSVGAVLKTNAYAFD